MHSDRGAIVDQLYPNPKSGKIHAVGSAVDDIGVAQVAALPQIEAIGAVFGIKDVITGTVF